MPSSTLPGLPTALLAASNAGTDLVYVAIDPFGATDDRKQDRTNFFAQVPVPVGLGQPATVQGSLIFYASTNANSITFRANTPAASLVYEWPNASPTVGQVLSASAPAAGVVTLTWVADSSTPGGSTTQVQYNNAGAFGGISGATSNGTNVTFGSTNLRATSPQITTGIQDANGNAILNFTATGGTVVNQLTLANSTTTNPIVISTTGTDTNIGLTISAKGTGVTTISGNMIANAGTGATTIGEASLGAEQLRVTSVSASRVTLSVNSLANATVDLVQATQNRSNTNTVANLATLTTNSNGAAAAGFGHSITHQLESSTTDGQVAAIEEVFWKVATHATRSSVYRLSTTDNASSTNRVVIAPRLALTDNVETTLFTFTLPTNGSAGGIVHATIVATQNGVASATWTGDIAYAATDDGGAVQHNFSVLGTPVLVGAGISTVTFDTDVTTLTVSFTVQVDVTSTPTAGQFYVIYSVEQNVGPALSLA